MLIEIFIFLEILALVLFGFAFVTKAPLFWAFGILICFALVFGGFDIQKTNVVVNHTQINDTSATTASITHDYTVETQNFFDHQYLAWINLAFSVVALFYFFYDLFGRRAA